MKIIIEKTIKKLFILLGIIYIFFCIFLFILQKSFIFFPTQNLYNVPSDSNIEEVYFDTSDDIKLHGWFIDNNSEKTVLFFHGNAGNVSHRIQQSDIFNDLKLNALIFDYREYGKSEGKIKKENDLYIDGLAALDFLLKEKEVELSNLILWGKSLGGAIAIHTAQNLDIYSTIIESSFYSMDYMASKKFPIFPTELLLKYHLRSDLKINNIKSDLLIIHSKTDEIIPYENGLKLFNEFEGSKQLLELSGSHNYGFITSQKLYIDTIKDFLDFY